LSQTRGSSPDPKVVTDPEWRERIIATGLPWRVRDNASQIEMLLVPPGTFMMGCSPSDQWGCRSNEDPVHEVTLTQPFYLGRYEVTQAQWTAVMGSNPSNFQSPSSQVPAAQVSNRPVERVSWTMIQDFEAATGLRLPTEAEWEYACRAGTQTAFNLPPTGTNDDGLLGQLAWFNQNAASQTHPVGQKQANNLGLHDMHGNAWEWVEDWYGGGYYGQSPSLDPPGPISGTLRVLRGGSWFDGSDWGVRASFRSGVNADLAGLNNGFRAARTP
jgi:formylglycine-generating enzyme required for sulfatase activity